MLLSYATQAAVYEPEQQPRKIFRTREMWSEGSEVNEVSKYKFNSGSDKALTKCKQPHVWKPRLESRDLSESRHTVKNPLGQNALPTSAHHAATSPHRCLSLQKISRRKCRHRQYHSPSSTVASSSSTVSIGISTGRSFCIRCHLTADLARKKHARP